MPKYTGHDADQLMDMLHPAVDRAYKLIDESSHPSSSVTWPCYKTDDRFAVVIEHHEPLKKYVITWQSTQSPPAFRRLWLIARFMGKVLCDQLILMPEDSTSVLRIHNSKMKCTVTYQSGGFPGTIAIASAWPTRVTPRDVIKYLERHPLPPIPTGKG